MSVTEVYWWDMSGATMDHDRDSGILHMAYHWDMRPYTPMIHQWRSTKKPSKLDSLPWVAHLSCVSTHFKAIHLLEMATNNTFI